LLFACIKDNHRLNIAGGCDLCELIERFGLGT